jgi:Niemann-Pick C1 protein
VPIWSQIPHIFRQLTFTRSRHFASDSMKALILLFLLSCALADLIRKEGYCAMYDNCGKKSIFGSSLPCPSNIKAVTPSNSETNILQRVCGLDFDISKVCCSEAQLINMEANLKRVDPLISSCPACRKNFYDFFCKFTCSPDQSTFINITKTAIATDTKNEVVSELTQFVDPDYADQFFQSCKNIKFSATNGYAMDLIGGGAKNYQQFLKFLGDEKPLLGGSPFQINFDYELKDNTTGLVLRSGDMKPCDDEVYKCACSDCEQSCPKLPKFHDYKKKCTFANIPCFSFTVLLVWICLFLVLGGFHIYLLNSRRTKNFDDDDSDVLDFTFSSINFHPNEPVDPFHSIQKKFLESVENGFERLGLFCASFPATTIGFCLLITGILCSGVFWIELETNPINLWVSPNEPALKQFHYFESNFGEWFRIEQLIISSKNESEPILNWENIKWWFEKELELSALNSNVSLDDICFKPLGESCAIESFAQYFDGNIAYLSENTWQQRIKSCADSPVNCLPSFQQPLKANLLFDNDNILESRAFVVTLLVNSNLTDPEHTESAISYEHLLQDWIKQLQKEKPDINIAFSTEVSLTEELNKTTNMDIKIIVISYLFMFVYASLALGGKLPSRNIRSLVKTRFALGLSGIIIILLSVVSSAGIFSMVGLKSTLIIAEVIPFLVLAIGIDNIFLIVHELHLINELSPNHSVEERIAKALRKVGPSCLISAVLQVSMFLLATRVDMPAVKNFAYYSAGGVLINFLLQMTVFVALLSLDQKRLESNRIDCFPCIQISVPVQLEDEVEHEEINFSNFIRKYYAPYILSKTLRPKLLTFFLVWLGISLSLLPKITYGLDQRLALPSDSYLVDYFNSVYDYLNVGPPVFFVTKNLDLTQRENQQRVCGKFSTCKEYSVANILEQEYKRGNKSTITDPASNWLDDFLTWLNPDLDQCCRFKKASPFEEPQFCAPNAPQRQCESCYAQREYDSSMNGFPTDDEFMMYFNEWIESPSDPCPLGGKAPYSTSISVVNNSIQASYFRAGHLPLRSQEDFINAYKNSLRIVDEIRGYDRDLEMFAFSPFYVFFVQYETIALLTFTLLGIASLVIWVVTTVMLGSFRSATIMTITVVSILINIGGIMAVWSISLNAVSLVNLVICAGLAVEFTIHITRAYTTNKFSLQDYHHDIYNDFMNNNLIGNHSENADDIVANVRLSKAFNALTTVGGSVLGGITITKIIGIAILAFARSQIFTVYYFRMWLALIAISAVHALCLLPILLSYFGDDHDPATGNNPDFADPQIPSPLTSPAPPGTVTSINNYGYGNDNH